MDELSQWMLTFKGKLDENTSSKVFQILQANGFTSRLQLKLLTREQIDVMFQNETKSEYNFIKNLSPRLFAIDSSYKPTRLNS